MKIGIFFYSFSGHALSVAKKINERLITSGYQVGMEKLEPAGRLNPSDLRTELKSIPSIEDYDILVIASPVHGGRMASPIAEFLEKTPSMKGKRVFCLVTHFLPYGTGGKQTILQMKAACQSKGGQIIGSENFPRLSLRQKTKINGIFNLLEKAM